MTSSGTQDVNLKVLYTFDNTTNFLARSSTPITARVITLPSQPPHNGSIIGLIDLQTCLSLIARTSPECFSSKSLDYSIYSKDVIEPDEPYVGFGLFSKVMLLSQPHVIVPGRICKNFLSSLFGNSGDVNVDTLEIKLRLSAVNASTNSSTSNSYQAPINTAATLAPPPPISKAKKTKKRKAIASPIESYDPHPTLKKRQPDLVQYLAPAQIQAPAPDINNNIQRRNSNKPELATRTQSMPFIQPIQPIQLTQPTQPQSDVSSRFANFINKQPATTKSNVPMRATRSNTESYPIKARKTKSFIRSVVKVGDSSIDSRKCINCKLSVPPFKYYNSGIFEFGNSGFLCCVCNDYYVTDNTDSLRARGELAAKGFLDDHYNKNTKKKSLRKRTTNRTDDDLTSSSPAAAPVSASSPLATVAMAKSRNAYSRKASSTSGLNYKNQENNSNNPQFMGTLGEMLITDNLPDYTNDGPKNTQHPLTDIDPLYQPHRQQTPQSQKEDDQPINAMKLNTTLIPLDDDDKENIPPPHLLQSHSTIVEEEKLNSIFGNEMLSPSLQRLIESMPGDVEASSSPSKPGANTDQWMNELFTHKEHPNEQIENPDDDDEEINRLINESKLHQTNTTTTTATKELMTSNSNTPSGKYDKTPADKFTPVDTVQTANISSESNTPCTNMNNTPAASTTTAKSNTPKPTLNSNTAMTSRNPYYNTSYNNSAKQTNNRKKLTMNNIPSSPYLMLPHEDQTNDIDDDDDDDDDTNETSVMDHWGNRNGSDGDRTRGVRSSSITEINDDDK